MTKTNLTNGLFAALLLTSPMVGAETEYPAADFKPKVIYQDEEQIAKHKETASSQDDSRYPAANFQPKVLYKDTEYKPSQTTTTSTSVPSKQSSKTAGVETAEPAAEAKTEKTAQSNSWIFLAVIAVAGVVLFSRRSKSAVQSGSASTEYRRASGVVPGDSGGATGVARYINRAMGTGVSRYLEKQAKTEKAVTGVAKYMAKQAVSSKVKVSEAATGVEKYMRRRG